MELGHGSGLKLRYKKGLCHRYFPVNFAKFLRKIFFIEGLRTTASETSFPRIGLRYFSDLIVVLLVATGCSLLYKISFLHFRFVFNFLQK